MIKENDCFVYLHDPNMLPHEQTSISLYRVHQRTHDYLIETRLLSYNHLQQLCAAIINKKITTKSYYYVRMRINSAI